MTVAPSPLPPDRPRTLDAALVDIARDTPIAEVAERLHLSLKKAGGDLKGPCPACGGDDRFAITPAKNVYVCRHCGGGDGIGLVQKALGCDFVSAVEFITGHSAREAIIDPAELDRCKQERAKKRAEEERIAERKREKARRDGYEIWKACRPAAGTDAEAYLRLRGIENSIVEAVIASKQVRFHPNLPYWGDVGEGKRELFQGPAMVCVIRRRDGTFGAVHRTWIDLNAPKGKPVVPGKDGKPLSMKLSMGSKQGGAIRLLHQDAEALPPTMVMGEGIETTLTAAGRAMDIWGRGLVAAWCGVDLGNMAGKALARDHQDHPGDDPRCWVCPQPVRRLIYLGDDGPEHKPTRTKLTRGLRRHLRRHGVNRLDLETRIAWAGENKDFNDLVAPEPKGDSDD